MITINSRMYGMLALAGGLISFCGLIHADQPSTHPAVTRPTLPKRHSITGLVQDADGQRVRADVFILDAETGVPYSNIGEGITHVATGTDGRFSIPGVFPGTYRLVAQYWDGDPFVDSSGQSMERLMDKKSDTTTLCGIIDYVDVIENQQPAFITLKPVGTASVHVDFEQNDTFLLVSTRHLTGDPILRELAWKGEFLQNLVGATYMHTKQATLHGLPDGPLYLYTMYNGDWVPQFGNASVVARAGAMVDVHIPMISPVKGPLTLPDRLVHLQQEMHSKAFNAAISASMGPNFHEPLTLATMFDLPLDREIALPSGQATTLRDVLTVNAYQGFNQQAQDMVKNRAVATQSAPR